MRLRLTDENWQWLRSTDQYAALFRATEVAYNNATLLRPNDDGHVCTHVGKHAPGQRAGANAFKFNDAYARQGAMQGRRHGDQALPDLSAYISAYSVRITFLFSLPTLVFGKVSTNKISSGNCHLANALDKCSRS